MFIIWIFIIAIVAILVVYLVSNKSGCCCGSGDSGAPAPKTEPPKAAAPAPPAKPETSGGENPAER